MQERSPFVVRDARPEHFSKVPHSILYDRRLRAEHLLAYLALARFANWRTGQGAFPAMATLGTCARLSWRLLRRALLDLERFGIIAVAWSCGGRSKHKGRGKTNEFTLLDVSTPAVQQVLESQHLLNVTPYDQQGELETSLPLPLSPTASVSTSPPVQINEKESAPTAPPPPPPSPKDPESADKALADADCSCYPIPASAAGREVAWLTSQWFINAFQTHGRRSMEPGGKIAGVMKRLAGHWGVGKVGAILEDYWEYAEKHGLRGSIDDFAGKAEMIYDLLQTRRHPAWRER